MARKLLFIHGTGVREDGYKASFALIERQLEKYASKIGVAPCRWGEKVGARLNFDGASIPTYGESRGVGVSEDAKNQAMWNLLLQDPSFELAMLSGAQGEEGSRPPEAAAETETLLDNFHELPKSKELKAQVAALGLDHHWPGVVAAIEKTPGFDVAKDSPQAGGLSHHHALARSVVAALEKASLESGGPTLDAVARDELTQAVSQRLGLGARGFASTLTAPFVGLAESIATWQIRRKRTSLTDASYPAAGDILVYQASGDAIRGFIRDEIAKYPDDELFLFAHSLGGIAAFELLVQDRPANVKALITFGSQAPFFYEIGALKTLGIDDKLPLHVPSWINFYDLNDPLSYVGGELFKGRVSDYRIESGQSFPASHSAYLQSRELWIQLEAFVRNA
jgi:hypothetical protein